MGRVTLLTLAAVLVALASCATVGVPRPGYEAQPITLEGSGAQVVKPAGWVSRPLLASQNGYAFLFVPATDGSDSCETVMYGLLLVGPNGSLSDLAAADLQRSWMFGGVLSIDPLSDEPSSAALGYDVIGLGPLMERRYYFGTPTITVLGLRSRRVEAFDRARADFGLLVGSFRGVPQASSLGAPALDDPPAAVDR